jgi:hypothetical protein
LLLVSVVLLLISICFLVLPVAGTCLLKVPIGSDACQLPFPGPEVLYFLSELSVFSPLPVQFLEVHLFDYRVFLHFLLQQLHVPCDLLDERLDLFVFYHHDWGALYIQLVGRGDSGLFVYRGSVLL